MFYISDPGCYELTKKLNTVTVKPEFTSNENLDTLSFSTVDVWVILLLNKIFIHISNDESLTIILKKQCVKLTKGVNLKRVYWNELIFSLCTHCSLYLINCFNIVRKVLSFLSTC